jgi:AraC-like DNA-binding protein
MTPTPGPIVPFVRDASFPVRSAWQTAPRRLLDYLLMYVQEGEMIANVEGREEAFRAGEFCLIQPGELHSLEGPSVTITPYVHLDVFYDPGREKSFVVRSGRVDVSGSAALMQPRLEAVTGVSVPTKFVPAIPSQFRDTMLKTIGTWQRRDFLGQLESHHLASGLVLEMLRSYSPGGADSPDRPEFLNWITSHMSLHLSEPLSVADMAERAGLSPSRFSRVFRDRFGSPPHRFLLHLRVQRAQDLLQHTGLTMRQISAQCGFSDVHHFAKTFKRVSGQTPGTYRWDIDPPDITQRANRPPS